MEALESAHEAVKVAITESVSAKKQSVYWKDLRTCRRTTTISRADCGRRKAAVSPRSEA
jgi:hypothetical protein